MAVQSVANGVKGIANELTKSGTAANKLFALPIISYLTLKDSPEIVAWLMFVP